MGEWKLLPQLAAYLMDGGLEQDHRDMLEDCLNSITSAATTTTTAEGQCDNNETADKASGTTTDEGPGSVIIRDQKEEEGNGFKGILNLITEALQEPILNRQFQKLLVGTTRAFSNFDNDQRGQSSQQQSVGDSAENNNCQTAKGTMGTVFDEPVWLETTESVNQAFHQIKEVEEEEANIRPDNNVKFLADEEDDYVDALSSVEEAGSSESLYFSDYAEPIITTPSEYIVCPKEV